MSRNANGTEEFLGCSGTEPGEDTDVQSKIV